FMAAQYDPKVLSKTIKYIAYLAPGEHGLFWEPDGTMPWKELYWALQAEPGLRFVRESHLREFEYLGLNMPFALDGSVLRLKDGVALPQYPLATALPERLYHACRRKHYLVALENGLEALGRTYLPLTKTRDMALKIGKRRDPEPIVIEVMARMAAADGIPLWTGGEELFLARSIPKDYVLYPMLREDEMARLTGATREKKEAKATATPAPPSPGSFFMSVDHFQDAASGAKTQDGRKSKKRGATWKRESRKERNKRNV
ncbi:MAG: hypothetical protein ACLGPL_06280, partial [Acidobacteriota bacterium]